MLLMFRRSVHTAAVLAAVCYYAATTAYAQNTPAERPQPAATDTAHADGGAIGRSGDGPASAATLRPLDFITNLPGDWARWYDRSFVAENAPVMSIIGFATAATLITDRPVYDEFHRHYTSSAGWHDFSEAATFIGDGKFQFGIAVLFAGYGALWNDTKALRTASQITEVILACGGVVQTLKHLTGRESPFVATQEIGRWVPFPNQIDYLNHVPHYDAYPSGHVATAMATLTVIAENYPEQRWIPWVGYSAITCLAVGMVSNGIHWWSDYPLSIALGWGFGQVVAHPEGKAHTPGSGVSTVIYPAPLPDGGLGMGFAMTW